MKIILIVVLSTLGIVIVLGLTCIILKDNTNENRLSRPEKPPATRKQSVSKAASRNVPKYDVVATNPNGHKIFIVTQAAKVEEFEAIVSDYKRRHGTPSKPWMINFFTDKEKALRVQREWMEPMPLIGDDEYWNGDEWNEDKYNWNMDEYYNKWVYQEDIDHSGTAQWTSWDGVTLDRW